jgi:hypothetical protein
MALQKSGYKATGISGALRRAERAIYWRIQGESKGFPPN